MSAMCEPQSANENLQSALKSEIGNLETTICKLQSKNCNLKTAICCWQSANCNLQPANRRLKYAICYLQTAISNMQSKMCNMQVAEREGKSRHSSLSLEGGYPSSALYTVDTDTEDFQILGATQFHIEIKILFQSQFQIGLNSNYE